MVCVCDSVQAALALFVCQTVTEGLRGVCDFIDRHRPIQLTTSRGHHLIKQLHAGPLPDFLDDCSQLFIGLLQITCTTGKQTSLRN